MNRSSGQLHESNILKLLNPASLITLSGLTFALAAMLSVLMGMPELSLIFLYGCILCDRLDGAVARKLNQVSAFGAELDNLSDAIAFGVVPAIFIAVISRTPWMLACSLCLVLGGVLRLARYSYVGLREHDGKKYFVGLPIPYTAAALFLIWPIIRTLDETIQSIILAAYAILIAFLMVSTISIRKGSAIERAAFYTIYPIVCIYLLLCHLGIRFW